MTRQEAELKSLEILPRGFADWKLDLEMVEQRRQMIADALERAYEDGHIDAARERGE
jgi:hypothetical protein